MLQSTTALVDDGAAAVGHLAVTLSRKGAAGLSEALGGLLATGLRSVVLRSVPQDGGVGELLAVAGEVVHAVPASRAAAVGPVVELPVCGPGGVALATLTVVGARPGLLPALRAAAAVLGLALLAATSGDAASDDAASEDGTSRTGGSDEVPNHVADLLDDAEQGLGGLADLLHDGVVQDLVFARYAADAAVRGADPALVREAVQQVLVGLRHSLWHLRPRGTSGLAEALQSLSDRLAEAGRGPLALTLAPGTDVLDPSAATTAYRLVQALALALDPGDTPLPVTLRRCPAPGGRAVIVLDTTTTGCADDLARWRRRAQAHGGELTVLGGRVRLVLPAPRAASALPAPSPLPCPAAPAPGRPPIAKATP